MDVKGLQRYTQLKNKYKDLTIVNPIMTGGILSRNVQEKIVGEGWIKVGYAICFDCIMGRSRFVSKPPIKRFLEDVASFFGGDVAEHTFGCRAAQFAVMKTIKRFWKENKSEFVDVVLVDSLCHYTTLVAAEFNGLRVAEVPHRGYPKYEIKVEDYINAIEKVKEDEGKPPVLIVVTHVEPYHGNMNPVTDVGKVAEDFGIPFMVNAAYTGGIMPVNMKDMHADFLTVSAHKSMASLGPLGFLVTSEEWCERVFSRSTLKTVWSGRSFEVKVPNLFGCSIGGIPLVSAMYSFEDVVKRVNRWEEELEKTRFFIKRLEELEGVRLIGERPHRHHLLHFETPIFYEISRHHKRRGFFLAEEAIKRGIVGLQRGITKSIKISVYGLSREEIERVAGVLKEIAETYTKKFNITF